MNSIAPFSCWVIRRVAALDVEHPGVAGHYLRASSERRQVVAAALSVVEVAEPPAAELGQHLSSADHNSILRRAFGEVPAGMRGALRRSGHQPHERAFYPLLHDTLSAPPHYKLIRAIQRLPTIDMVKLKIARTLSSDLCHAEIIVRLFDEDQARELTALVPRMVEAGAGHARLIAALASCKGRGGLHEVLCRWSTRLRFPLPPLAASPQLQPVVDGKSLEKLALRFRNCARALAADILDSRLALAVFSHAGQDVILHLKSTSLGWYLEEVHGYRNREVSNELRAAAEQYCREQGAVRRPVAEDDRSDWCLLRTAARRRQFEGW